LDNDNKDNIEDIDEDDDDEESSIDDEDSSINDNELIEETNIEDNLDEMKEISNFEEISSLDLKSIDFKQINISGLDKSAIDNEEYDYKKFSLNKLKSLVMEKGLMKDPSKMKKNELLKLLGV
jgi:putative N-acetylmannosamine-6-phosphate epimerase